MDELLIKDAAMDASAAYKAWYYGSQDWVRKRHPMYATAGYAC